jgi:hypothetical protein
MDIARLKVDDQISKKSSNHEGSINDKRQEIGGHLTLLDTGSSLQKPLGAFRWKTFLFGKPCGREKEQGEFLVFSSKEGQGDLPLQGKLRMEVEPVTTVYDKVGSGNYGFEYFGYAVLVRSSSDEKVVLVKSDKKVLERSPEKLDELSGGELLDKGWNVVRQRLRPYQGIQR